MPMPGFVIGHNYWLGSIEGCKAVQQQPLSIRMSNRFERFTHNSLWSEMAPFDIDYRMVYAEHRSSFQIQVEFFLEKNVFNAVLRHTLSSFAYFSYKYLWK